MRARRDQGLPKSIRCPANPGGGFPQVPDAGYPMQGPGRYVEYLDARKAAMLGAMAGMTVSDPPRT
jgi:hypothetical protein